MAILLVAGTPKLLMLRSLVMTHSVTGLLAGNCKIDPRHCCVCIILLICCLTTHACPLFFFFFWLSSLPVPVHHLHDLQHELLLPSVIEPWTGINPSCSSNCLLVPLWAISILICILWRFTRPGAVVLQALLACITVTGSSSVLSNGPDTNSPHHCPLLGS